MNKSSSVIQICPPIPQALFAAADVWSPHRRFRAKVGGQRRYNNTDRPAYSPRATREALANAICHRDYIIPGAAVAVAMYEDHLEIVSPGGFHFGIEPAKLAIPHESKPWNPIIANVFYRAGIIERWDMGTLKILDWCREFDCPPPEWKEQADNV